MIDNEEDKGTAAVVANIVEALAKAEEIAIVEDDGILVVPESKKVVDLRPFEDARRENPRRRKGTSTHTTLASFLDHVGRTKDAGSVIFADDSARCPSFLAIYDYNEEARVSDYSVDPPTHRPAGPVALMALSRGLIVRADRKVGSAVNLNTGEAKITFSEEHAASINDAPVVVPTGFVLSIPVFRDGEAYAAIVRLRYRVEGARVKWKLALVRPDVLLRDAFFAVSRDVKSKTGLDLFFGSPEK